MQPHRALSITKIMVAYTHNIHLWTAQLWYLAWYEKVTLYTQSQFQTASSQWNTNPGQQTTKQSNSWYRVKPKQQCDYLMCRTIGKYMSFDIPIQSMNTQPMSETTVWVVLIEKHTPDQPARACQNTSKTCFSTTPPHIRW